MPTFCHNLHKIISHSGCSFAKMLIKPGFLHQETVIDFFFLLDFSYFYFAFPAEYYLFVCYEVYHSQQFFSHVGNRSSAYFVHIFTSTIGSVCTLLKNATWHQYYRGWKPGPLIRKTCP